MTDSRPQLQWADEKEEYADFQNNYALIIGINDYGAGIRPLATAANDACRLADILSRQHGYTVTQLTETVTYDRIRAELCERLPGRIGKDDRFLFYFAGHGIATKLDDEFQEPEGFLLLQDAVRDQSSTYLPMARLHQWLSQLQCRHLLAILDCCFAGAFRWSINTRESEILPDVIYWEKYLRYIQDPAWQVIASASYDQRALDHLGGDQLGERGESMRHSPFAQALFDGLAGKADLIPRHGGDGLITATELQLYLRDTLDSSFDSIVQRRQTPELWHLRKHRKGEFVFKMGSLALPRAPELGSESNPYRGLDSYREVDEALFFGREAQSERLLQRVCAQPLTIVLGASGTGKSSLVKAGLLPGLRRAGSPPWQILPILRPGTEPLRQLEQIFAAPGIDFPAQTDEGQGRFSSQKWLQAVSHVVNSEAANASTRFLLIVDQVEELVTLCRADERAQFIERLCLLLSEFAGRIHIVLTLRNDFEPHIRNTCLQTYWENGRFVVAPMNQQELKEVIERPAAARVLFFDPPDLVDKIAEEVVHEPNALPLLSFTLSQLYRRYLDGDRHNRTLTSGDYGAIGGVIGILSRCAGEVYEDFDEAHRLTMRRLLLRMVTIESGEKARRRVPRAELIYPSPEENARVECVLKTLVDDARLLAQDNAQASGQTFVEPAHEALINAWDKLSEWMRDEDETILLHRNLTQAASLWSHAKGNARTGLLWSRDPRLAQVHQTLAPHDYAKGRMLKRTFLPSTQVSAPLIWLNSSELDFVQASIRKKAASARWLALIVLLFVAAALGLWNLSRIASVEQRTRQIAESRRLANIALQEIEASPIQSIKLSRSGLPAAGQDRPYVPEAENALTQAIQRNQLRQIVSVGVQGVEQVAFGTDAIAVGGNSLTLLSHRDLEVRPRSPVFDPAWLATTAPISPTRLLDEQVQLVAWADNGDLLSLGPHTARIWRNGRLLHMRNVDDAGYISCAVWNPRSNMLAFCSDMHVRIWLLAADEMLLLPPATTFVNGVSWAADGSQLAVITSEQVTVHTLAGDEPTVVLASPEGDIQAARFIGSTELLTWGLDRPVQRWSTSGRLLGVYEDQRDRANHRDVQLSPDGAWLAAASDHGWIDLWPLAGAGATPETLLSDRDYAVLALAWHGSYLASAGADGIINLWDWQKRRLVTRLGSHAGRIHGLAWSPDGRRLISYGEDATLRTWQVFDKDGLPICDLGEEVAETWRCSTLLRTQLQAEDPLPQVTWVGNTQIVGTTSGGELWTWRIDDAAAAPNQGHESTSVPPPGRRAELSASGMYGFVFAPQGAGELWQNVAGTWARLDTFAQPISNAFWSGDQLILVKPSNQIDVVTIAGDSYTQRTIPAAVDRVVWEAGAHNNRLVVAYRDGGLEMFDLGLQRRLFSIPGEKDMLLGDFTWLDGGAKLLMRTVSTGAISQIDADSGRSVWPSLWHEEMGDPLPPVPNPTSPYTVFAIDGTLYALDLRDRSELILAQIPDTFRGLQWNGAGTRLLTWDSGGAARIWHWNEADLSLVQILELRAHQPLLSASYNPDESLVMTADREGNVRVWQVWPTLEALLKLVAE